MTLLVTGNDPSPAQFEGNADCVDVTFGPGEYAVSEGGIMPSATEITGDCVQDPNTHKELLSFLWHL